jgi:hypothetical protein
VQISRLLQPWLRLPFLVFVVCVFTDAIGFIQILQKFALSS